MKFIDVDGPPDISLVMQYTDDPSEVENLKHVTWTTVEHNDRAVLLMGYQDIGDNVASVSGFMLDDAHKTLLTRSLYVMWLRFMDRLKCEGFTHVFASTLRTNSQGIRFNEHYGYEPIADDDLSIYWLKEL